MLPLRFPKGWQVVSVVLLLLVLTAAITPSLWSGRGPVRIWFAPFDKWAHAVTFAFLAVWFAGLYRRNAYWRVALGLFLFGVLIEVCQRFVQSRTAEWFDVAADLTGIVVGLAIAFAGLGGWAMHVEAWYARARQSS
jgi:VanZ family protein